MSVEEKSKIPYIEEKEYEGYSEFRVMKWMKPSHDTGCWEYHAKWEDHVSSQGFCDIVFIAKKPKGIFANNWLIPGSSFEERRRKCIEKCNEIIVELVQTTYPITRKIKPFGPTTDDPEDEE